MTSTAKRSTGKNVPPAVFSPANIRPPAQPGTRWALSAGGVDEQGRRCREFTLSYTEGHRAGLAVKDGEGNPVIFRELLAPALYDSPRITHLHLTEASAYTQCGEFRDNVCYSEEVADAATLYRTGDGFYCLRCVGNAAVQPQTQEATR